MATISQRISLEGSEDIRKQLAQLGDAGEAAFKQIQEAAKKPITDPGQIDKTRQAFDSLAATTSKLGPQFQALADSAKQFGTQGVQATQAVAQGLNQTNAAAAKTGSSFQQIATGSNLATVGLVALGSALGTVLAGALDKVTGLVASFSVSNLTQGAVETAQALQGQADKIHLSVEEWLQLRKALQSTTVSWDDAVRGLTKLGQVIEQSQSGLARWRETIVQTADGEVTIRKFSGAIADTTTIAGKAAAALRELGVSAGTIAGGNKLAIMQEVAAAIDKIPSAAERADRGLRVFGNNWEDIIKSLIRSKALLEANRDLLPEQVAQLKKLGDAWDTLGTAVRSVKDQIGLLFAGPATAKAEWLTTLADGVRKLIVEFSKLSDAKQAIFLSGLGGSPAETAFKILIALGQQLAGLWRDVLVPAGQKVAEIARSIAGSFQGVSGSQVAAFFITAAIAATGLAVALKGIALALSPIASLISFAFSPLGIILIGLGAVVVAFWDKFKAAAQAALALIPQELQQMKAALASLFQGNFTGFWNQFSAAAVSAFQTIKTAALGTNIGQQFQTMFSTVLSILKGVETAANGMAAAINNVFGTNLTGPMIIALGVIGQVTGAFDLLKNVVGIVGPAITTVLVSIGALVTIFGGIPVAVGLAATALAGLIVYLDPGAWTFYSTAAKGAFDLIVSGANLAKGAIAALTGSVTGGVSAWGIFRDAALGALNPIYGAINGLLRLIEATSQALANLREMQAPSAPLPEPGGVPFARGGHVGGRGTGTSDSNLAWLSRGEYVIPARAVRQPGVLALLEALRRSGGNLRGVLNDMGRFARGGLVLPVPAFASGGRNGGGSSASRVLNLTIEGRSFGGLSVPEATAQSLERFAVHSQIASTGRKPSWRR